jgi:hypothetical protein
MRKAIGELVEDLVVTAFRALRHAEGVVGALCDVQRSAVAECVTQGLDQLQIRQAIARALQEEHG